jgi:hypothetical protein
MGSFFGRPRIKLMLSPGDRVLEIVSWLALAGLWTVVLFYYPLLPDTIPTRFNAAGHADGYGTKASLFVLPSIATAMAIGMTLLNRYPHLYNYPVSITTDNALRHYTSATRLIRGIKTAIPVAFLLIVRKTIRVSGGSADEAGGYFLLLEILIIFVPLLAYCFSLLRSSRRKNVA